MEKFAMVDCTCLLYGACHAASRVYDDPMPGGENGYAVTVDGARAVVSDVRNSAMPVNIRWPGHQRELDQTEIGGLVRFEFKGAAHVEVTSPRDFREVRIRPSSRGVQPVVKGRKVSFELTRPGGYSVEFDGIHSNLLVLADAPADYAVDASDPQTIYFGPGVHEAGLIELKSGQTLYIHEDAVVFGRDADGIRILGRGILDGSHVKAEILPIDPALAEEQRRKGFAITNYRRYDAIRLEYCDDMLIDGIVVRDSPVCDIQNCDYADIHDIAFDDIRIEQDSPVYRHILAEKASAFDPTPLENASPPVFEASVRVIPEYSKDDTRRGLIRDVTLRDIRVTGPDCPKIRLGGYDQDHGTTGVTIRGIYWNGREASKEVGENQQVRPFAEPARFAP